jgi:hypothetical protein
MTAQLDMFALMRPRPVLQPVDPDGPVVQGAPDVTLRLPHPKLAWDLSAIELHQHTDGRWMWGTHTASGGYKVGPKWGRFAATQGQARQFGAMEIIDWCDRNAESWGLTISAAQVRQIRAWAEGLLA